MEQESVGKRAEKRVEHRAQKGSMKEEQISDPDPDL
jgi:hypothetical protein